MSIEEWAGTPCRTKKITRQGETYQEIEFAIRDNCQNCSKGYWYWPSKFRRRCASCAYKRKNRIQEDENE